MKTLIIDDEVAMRTILLKVFSNLGVCHAASDGAEGLGLIKGAYTSKPYNFVILDIVLPEVCGHTVIKEIRRLEQKYNISPLEEAKILVVSSRMDEPTLLQAFRNGATGWVTKPASYEQIWNYMKVFGIKT